MILINTGDPENIFGETDFYGLYYIIWLRCVFCYYLLRYSVGPY